MTFPWSNVGPHRKPLKISWCGDFSSGLRIGSGASAQFYPKHGNPRQWLTGDQMPVRWDTESGVFPYSSSDFTGEMHAYAQVLMAHPKALTLFNPAGGGFRADWDHTHGIYVQTLGDGSKRLWCISISSSGVFARRLPHCLVPSGFTAPPPPATGATESEWQRWDAELFKELRGYYPHAPADLQWFDTSSGWIQLADAASVSAFYSLSPFYSRCGWAFDSNGSRAVNTGYRYESDPVSHGYHAFEYVISITADSNGVPASASVNVGIDGYIKYIWNGTLPAPARFVVPGSAQNAGVLEKFDLSLSDVTLQVIGNAGEVAPLVSYYNASGQITGLVHINDVVIEDGIPVSPSYGPYDPLPVGVVVEDNGTRSSGFTGGVYTRGEGQSSYYKKTGTTEEWYTVAQNYPLLQTLSGNDWLMSPDEVYAIQNVVYDWIGEFGVTSYEVGIVPIGDRECHYRYSMSSTNKQYNKSTGTAANLRYGLVWISNNNSTASRNRRDVGETKCNSGLGTCNGSDVQQGTVTFYRSYGPFSISASQRNKNSSRIVGNLYEVVSYTPQTVTYQCPGGVLQSDSGWCPSNYIIGSATITGVPAPEGSTSGNDDSSRTERLVFHHANHGAVQVFQNDEVWDGISWKTVLLPSEGNKYAFVDWNGQRMFCWSDLTTGAVVYSSAYNADSGPGFLSGNAQDYPIADLPAESVHSWIGAPGAL